MEERAAQNDPNRPRHKYWVPSVGFWVVVVAGLVAVTCVVWWVLFWTFFPPFGPVTDPPNKAQQWSRPYSAVPG